MSERRDRDYIEDIRVAIARIERYTANLSREQLEADEKTQDAVIRNLEVIGEAAKNVSASLRREHSHIPWKDLAGVRDKLIHHYFWGQSHHHLGNYPRRFAVLASRIGRGVACSCGARPSARKLIRAKAEDLRGFLKPGRSFCLLHHSRARHRAAREDLRR